MRLQPCDDYCDERHYQIMTRHRRESGYRMNRHIGMYYRSKHVQATSARYLRLQIFHGAILEAGCALDRGSEP